VEAAVTPLSSLAPELTLPPPFTPIKLREVGDAFGHARAIAAASGAGTLVHVGRFDLAEFAVIVEPEEPLRSARRVFYAGMAALADALAASSEPETAIEIVWPDAITVNLGLVGGGRLAWPMRTAEDEIPAWLVFGVMIRVVSLVRDEPGLNPLSTALEEEGFGSTVSDQVIERFARHFMVAIDSWQENGFVAVARKYLPYLARESGVRRDIDENGDLLVTHAGKAKVERLPLVAALAQPSWLDPETKGPRA
jgi:biotin-(acetyl-CoA carboxylase) ligase